jgi:LysM repeat protein
MWTKSACVVLAWSALIILVAVGMKGPDRQAQANIRIASSTTQVTLASTVSVAAVHATAPRPATKYVVQPGDTLSGIAARFAVFGGWPALYAANRPLIGADPSVIQPGTVLVLPGATTSTHYTVEAGDTLSGIATEFAVPGGWQALYAANRRVVGPDPNVIQAGTVLTVRAAPVPSPAASSPGRPHSTAPAPSSAGSGHRSPPTAARSPGAAGMPQWLKTVLLAVALIIGTAFLAEPVLLAIRRRRRRASARAATLAEQATEPLPVPAPRSGPEPDSGQIVAKKPRIVVADYDQVVVTQSPDDGMVYVLRPPDVAPGEILRTARLVLPEGPYEELAARLGMPASWPIVLADYDQVVVTQSEADGMVCVLRPPGEDPEVILRAARLVLREDPYEELAAQLGVPADLPMR